MRVASCWLLAAGLLGLCLVDLYDPWGWGLGGDPKGSNRDLFDPAVGWLYACLSSEDLHDDDDDRANFGVALDPLDSLSLSLACSLLSRRLLRVSRIPGRCGAKLIPSIRRRGQGSRRGSRGIVMVQEITPSLGSPPPPRARKPSSDHSIWRFRPNRA